MKYSQRENFDRYLITDISIYNAVAKSTPRNKQLANLMDRVENLNMFYIILVFNLTVGFIQTNIV